MKQKILLSAIIRGDTEHDRASTMLKSFMPYCDGLVVGVSGIDESHDRLKKLIKSYQGHYIKITPETHPQVYTKDDKGYFFSNFAEARNIVFDFADKLQGFDWYTWADADDILVGGQGLQLVAQKADAIHADRVFFTYWYALKVRPDNTFDEDCVMIEHDRERLIRPRKFKWVSRLHEVTLPKDQNYKSVDAPYRFDSKAGQEVVWAHLTNEKRALDNMQRNIKILEMQAKEENHQDPRTLFYLAKTYYDMGAKEKDELALMLLQEYRKMSGWAEERANSWEYTANILCRRGHHKEATVALFEALKEYPNRHMYYLLLAKEHSEIGLTESSDFWLDTVLRMDPPQSRTTIGNPLEIKFMAASMMFNRAMRELKLKDAVMWLKKRSEIGGVDDRERLKMLEDAILLNDAGMWAYNFAQWLNKTGHKDKIQYLLQALPQELGQEPFATYLANEVAEPKVWDKKSIVYVASWQAQHFEKWSPKNMDSGIGGSETAVIELSKRWVKKGYDVTVYGDPREDAGDYEGVHYRPYYELNWKDKFNILIIWRTPHALDKELHAKKILYDAHDIESNLNWTKERVDKVDKVFFKSKFHRSMCPNIPDDKVVVIGNGI